MLAINHQHWEHFLTDKHYLYRCEKNTIFAFTKGCGLTRINHNGSVNVRLNI